MDWSRAKNLSIAVFFLLNVVLLFLNYLDSRQYILSNSNINAITTVLDRNNITLHDDFTFAQHQPRRQISFNQINISQNFLANVFMINNTNIGISLEEEGGTLFFNEYEEVMFTQDYVLYRNIRNTSIHVNNYQEARIYAAGILSLLGDMGRYMVLDRSITDGDTFVLEYRMAYRNSIIYSNFIIFTFRGGIIETIQFNYNTVNGFMGNPREIRQADEIMLAFMREIPGADTEVLHMDIVYKNIGSVGIPHYRIRYRNAYSEATMLINAYTNIVTREAYYR